MTMHDYHSDDDGFNSARGLSNALWLAAAAYLVLGLGLMAAVLWW